MDEMVLTTQKWLNSTYKTVAGFNAVPEDGRTGWPTIYGLRRALQYEMGITALSNNFGDGTTAAFNSKVVPTLNNTNGKPKSNIVKIIQGGFWCKGINPYTSGLPLDGIYNNKAVKTFQGMAGIAQDGKMSAMLMKALLDMSAFVLIPGGDINIRTIQQELNKNYNNYFGLLSCDGLYQRDTNTALIFALQSEIGMGVGVANGIYGPGTTSQTPTVSLGNTGIKVKIVQWGLYVNGFNKNAQFDGVYTSYIASEVKNYRSFMKLPRYDNGSADMTVIKGLLSSAGNTSRTAEACDMATQLTLSQAQNIKKNGFNIVGRYLTGSVGVGTSKKDKNLTSLEIKNIVSAGLNIFPIYQDGGWSESYFTYSQGSTDAQLAHNAAFNLGFPVGTTIYFAVDTDIQDGNIAGTVLKYIEAVKKQIDSNGVYKVGIYGTRNVCQRSVSAGFVENCFVSDMSTGFSGNLGFKMPEKWAFDQFNENSDLGFPIDKVAVSGRDLGTNKFVSQIENLRNVQSKKLLTAVKDVLKLDIGEVNLTLDYPTKIVNTPTIEAYATLSSSWTYKRDDSGLIFDISLGKASENKFFLNSFDKTLNVYKDVLSTAQRDQTTALINKLAPTVGNGHIETGICVNKNSKLLGTKLIIKQSYGEGSTKGLLQLVIEVYPKLIAFPPNAVSVLNYNNSYNTANNFLDGKLVLSVLAASVIAVVSIVALCSGIPELAAGVSTIASGAMLLWNSLAAGLAH